jgi:uncharacterized protein with LGFP repeats/L,D-peptidoglycan transpeptidase YkuD (ErfK/YbiS/YcfS/YnhG family)
MNRALRAAQSLLAASALVGASMIGLAPGAFASAQVYNPCDRLSAGQVKFSAFGAKRVTFATSTDRSSDVVTITGCVRSGAGYVQEWQDWGYIGQNGFAAGGTWEDTWKSPSGSYSFTEALGRSNPGTALQYHTLNPYSRWGGEHGATYNQYFEGVGGESDENLWDNMNLGYYEQAAVINYNREPDMPTVQGASFAIFFHAGRVPSAGCVSTALSTVTRLLQTNQPGDRIIMGAVDDVFTPYSSNPFGAINAKYGSLWGTFGMLGAPASSETSGLRDGGAYQLYANGAINWSPATGAHVSMGAIRGAWARNGFEGGPLGYPTTDEVGGLKDGGVYQMYQGGSIVWAPGIGAYATRGAIRAAYASSGFEGGPLGYAVSDEAGGLKDGGTYQLFQNGAINWSPATGAHISMGAIRGAWAASGFESGPMGYPTSDEYPIGGGAVAQNYQGGAITWAPGIGAYAIPGGIGASFQGHTALGAAVTRQTGGLVNGGVYQMFQNGAINWSPATGAHISTGAIRSVWAGTGFESGALGYPTSDEIPVSGGVYQNYQGGAIYWSPATGAHAVFGDFATKMTPSAFAGIGFPVGNQVSGLVDGGSYQSFQRAVLVWSAATGVHITTGPIRTAWGSTGFESGSLGYPTSDPYPGTLGSTVQNFQKGQIAVGADGTVSITAAASPVPSATSAATATATAPAP